MAKLDPTKFRVSSALKNIIGKELITDDFIAVFELVKNSFDAHAAQVDIFFENIRGGDARLVIWDDGKGMDKEDITKKWLFVAYSAKKEGVEDYRDKIRSKRVHAGAKGIGRFSCDRLGDTLTIYTKRKGQDSKINKLVVDWSDFEQDSQEEFVNIDVKHSYAKEVPYENFKHGTILEIAGLREEWDREKLLKLKHSLEKLINPNQENDPHGFSIVLNVEEEEKKDREKKAKGENREIVNGEIENKIFEDLEIKTTKIEATISKDGRFIETILEDKGALIYKIKEKSNYEDLLKDIKITVFYLSQPAKSLFTKKMGVDSVSYGSIFLYKNGFRIYPFGEEGEDILKIDRRKAQGYARYLGTREIIGRIEINGENTKFKETSSRDGGLIKNNNFIALEKFFKSYILRRLEKYVIEVINWGRLGEFDDLKKQDPIELGKNIAEIITNLTNSKNLVNLNYDKKFVDILENRTEKSLNSTLKNLNRIAKQTENPSIVKLARQVDRKYKSVLKAKDEAEKSEHIASQKTKKAKEEVELKTSQNLFLKAAIPQDVKFLDNLCHSVGMYADGMRDDIRDISQELLRKTIRKSVISDALKNISYHTNTISSLAKFATRANFKIKVAKTKRDLVGFIREHIINVAENFYKKEIKITYKQGVDGKFFCNFRPIEITMLLDNLISNSTKKAVKATLFEIEVFSLTSTSFKICFTDNGKGVPESVRNTLFEEGITTTEGSGLGLFHVKEILAEMNSEIEYNKEYKKGTQFIITFRK